MNLIDLHGCRAGLFLVREQCDMRIAVRVRAAPRWCGIPDLNPQMSKVEQVRNCIYLGCITGKICVLRITPLSVIKPKAKMRQIHRRNRLPLLREVIAEFTPVRMGRANYFKFAVINQLFLELDEWTRRQLRYLRFKQSKRLKGIRRFHESVGVK